MLLPLLQNNLLAPSAGEPIFVGPNIANMTFYQGVAISPRDFSGRWTSGLPLTFTVQSGVLPTGLSLSAAGVLSGTPTVIESQIGISIRASDGVDFADSNTFAISIVVAPPYGPVTGPGVRGRGVQGVGVPGNGVQGPPILT